MWLDFNSNMQFSQRIYIDSHALSLPLSLCVGTNTNTQQCIAFNFNLVSKFMSIFAFSFIYSISMERVLNNWIVSFTLSKWSQKCNCCENGIEKMVTKHAANNKGVTVCQLFASKRWKFILFSVFRRAKKQQVCDSERNKRTKEEKLGAKTPFCRYSLSSKTHIIMFLTSVDLFDAPKKIKCCSSFCLAPAIVSWWMCSFQTEFAIVCNENTVSEYFERSGIFFSEMSVRFRPVFVELQTISKCWINTSHS